MAFKLTKQQSSVIAVLKNGAYLQLPAGLRTNQNVSTVLTMTFCMVGAVGPTYLVGGNLAEIAVTADGALTILTEYDAIRTIAAAGSIRANTWTTIEIERYTPANPSLTKVTINGVVYPVVNGEAFNSPFTMGFIGRGRTDQPATNNASGSSVLLLKDFKLVHNNATLIDLNFTDIPQETSLNRFSVGMNVIRVSNYLDVEWVEDYPTGGISLATPIDINQNFTAMLEYRERRTNPLPNKLQPILTRRINQNTHSGFFGTEQGGVVLAKNIVDGNLPLIYPAVTRADSNSTRYISLGQNNWTCVSNSAWAFAITCAISSAELTELMSSSRTVSLLGVVNSGPTVSLVFSPTGVKLTLSSSTATLLESTEFTIQPNIMYTYKAECVGSNWVLYLNGTTLATVAASVVTMRTNNMIWQTTTYPGNFQDRLMYVESITFYGGTFTDTWHYRNFNPLASMKYHTWQTASNNGNKWISTAGTRILSIYLAQATSSYWYDPSGTLLHIWPNNDGNWFKSNTSRHRLKLFIQRSAGILSVSYGATSGGSVPGTTNNPATLSYTLSELSSHIFSIQQLDCILGGGYSDFFGATLTSINGSQNITVDSTGLLSTGTVTDLTTTIENPSSNTVINIPDPYIKILNTNEVFSIFNSTVRDRIATLTLSNPLVEVEVSGFVQTPMGTQIILGPNQASNFNRISYRAAQGQEFSGKLFDDSIASISVFHDNSSTLGLRVMGGHNIDISGIVFYGTYCRVGLLESYNSTNTEPIKLTKVGMVGRVLGSIITQIGSPAVADNVVVHGAMYSALPLPTKISQSTIGECVYNSSTYHGCVALYVDSSIAVREVTTPGYDFYAPGGFFTNCAGSKLSTGAGQLGASIRDFVDYYRGDLRVKPNSRLYNAGVGAFSLGVAPNIGNYTLDSLAVSGTGPDLLYPNSHAIDNAIQEVIKAFQTAANISSTRTQSKDISVTYAVLANIVQSILQQKGITKSFSDIANEITGIAGSKTVTNYRNVIAQVVASASAGSKTTLSNIAINAAINAQYTHLALMGAMGTFATQVSVIRTIMANKTAVATYGSQAQVSRTGSQTKTTTKAHATSGTFSSTRTTQKGITASFITTGIATRQGSQTKQVTKGGATSAVESSLFYASKTVTKGYTSSANITRWSTYIKLYEILGTFFSSGVFSSNSPGGSKTATGSYTRSATVNTVRTTSKHMEKSFSDLATVSSSKVARKEVALPLTPSSATLNTNYTIEKTSYVGYNTYLVITSEMRGTSKDVAKKLATYITESDSIIKYTSAVTSIEQYSVKLFRNTAEYQTQQLSEYSLGESNVIAASVTYKTQSSSIARY